MIIQQPFPASLSSLADDEFVLIFDAVTVGTSGSPADRSTATIPSGVISYRPYAALVRTVSAAGTLAAATYGIYSASAAGGTNLVAPVAMTALTAVDTIQDLTVISLASVLTAQTLYLRQTLDSLNAGTMHLRLYCRKIS